MIPGLTLAVKTPIGPSVILTFKSVSSASTTFGVEYRGADDPIWDDGIGNVLQPAKSGNNSVATFPWTTSAEKSVTIYVLDPSAIFGVETFSNTGLTEINMLLATNWASGITINLSSNTGLTSVTLPDATGDNVYLQSCSGLTTFNLTNVTGNMGNVWAFNCTSLTSILFPPGIGLGFTWISNTGIAGHFDMSNVTRIGNTNVSNNDSMTSYSTAVENPYVQLGNFNISGSALLAGTLDLSDLYLDNSVVLNSCPNITAITLPLTSNGVYINCSITGISTIDYNSMTLEGLMQANSCPNLTSMDWSQVINNGIEAVNFYLNPNLGYVDLTGISSPVTEITNYIAGIRDNGWSAAIVNHMLVDQNTLATNGFTGRSINIGGINDANAAPDTTSGGFNGTAAVTDLVNNKGFTVITN